MAKKIIFAGLILMLMLSLSAPAYADDAVKKLGRGLCNICTFPIELPFQVSRINNSDGPSAAMTYGVVKGITMMVCRLSVGVYETITFPFPVPSGYKPILTDPEFMFEEKSW